MHFIASSDLQGPLRPHCCYSFLQFCSTRKSTQQAAQMLVKDARFIMNSQHRQRFVYKTVYFASPVFRLAFRPWDCIYFNGITNVHVIKQLTNIK